eukprot:7512480-Pyramimonas_sp.AAC.1
MAAQAERASVQAKSRPVSHCLPPQICLLLTTSKRHPCLRRSPHKSPNLPSSGSSKQQQQQQQQQHNK